MKTRKPDTVQTYDIIKEKSNYNISPMESAVDPRVRIAAMTVAEYYQSNKDRENLSGPGSVDPLVASKVIDEIDSNVMTENQGFYNTMREFEENGRAALPWFGKMLALIPNTMDRIAKYKERQAALSADENAGYLDMVYGYSEMILDALVDLIELAFVDSRQAVQDMLCCMMFYGNIQVPEREDIDKEGLKKVLEWLTTVRDFLSETEGTVNKGIGDVNGIAESLNKMLSTILKVAIYGIISVISSKAEEMLENMGDKLNVTICGKSLSEYIHLEFINSQEEVSVFGSMLGNIVDKFEKKEEPVVVVTLLALAGISNTDAYEFINYSHENYINMLEKSKQGPDADDQDICRMCMPFFDMLQMSINQGLNSSVSWLTDLTKKLIASAVNFKLNSVDFKLIDIINKAIRIVERIIEIDFSSAKLEDCYKKVKSIKEDDIVEITPVPSNDDPNDIGKVLKGIGFKENITDLPEDFLKRIEERYDPKTPQERINDIIHESEITIGDFYTGSGTGDSAGDNFWSRTDGAPPSEYGDSYTGVTQGWNRDPSYRHDNGADNQFEIDTTDAMEIIRRITSDPDAFDHIIKSNDPKKILDELTGKYKNAARGVIGKRSVYMRYFEDVNKALASLSRFK